MLNEQRNHHSRQGLETQFIAREVAMRQFDSYSTQGCHVITFFLNKRVIKVIDHSCLAFLEVGQKLWSNAESQFSEAKKLWSTFHHNLDCSSEGWSCPSGVSLALLKPTFNHLSCAWRVVAVQDLSCITDIPQKLNQGLWRGNQGFCGFRKDECMPILNKSTKKDFNSSK